MLLSVQPIATGSNEERTAFGGPGKDLQVGGCGPRGQQLPAFQKKTNNKQQKNKTMKIIAIVGMSAALASVAQAQLEVKFPGATFEIKERISDRTPGAMVATLGLPGYIPGNEAVKVLSFGSRLIQNATAEQRSHQWETLRSKTATPEQVAEQLGSFEEYIILKGSAIKDIKLALSDVRFEIAEAQTAEEKVVAYKKAYDILTAAIG